MSQIRWHSPFSELQAAKAFGRYEKKFVEFSKVPLLIIDDFGLRPMRSPQDEDFHDLISERYERASTIVTSNLDFSEWGNAFPNQLLAAATWIVSVTMHIKLFSRG